MNDRILHFCLAAVLFPACHMVAVAAPAPRIAVDQPVYDFGKQPNNRVIEHTFEIRNTGDVTLEIQGIRSTCGCTVGTLDTDLVAPGDVLPLTARYDLRGRRGAQQSILTVRTSDPHQPDTRLTLIGEAVETLRVQPRRVHFGHLPAGERTSLAVQIEGVHDQPFELTKAETGTAHFSIRATETVHPHHYRVTIEVDTSEGAGFLRDVAEIHTTHPDGPVIEIALHAQVEGPLRVAPERITLMGGTDRPVTRYVVVRPGSVRDFKITNVTPPQNNIRVNVMDLKEQGYRIQLSNVRATDDLAGQSLKISTTTEAMPHIEIPFEILAVP